MKVDLWNIEKGYTFAFKDGCANIITKADNPNGHYLIGDIYGDRYMVDRNANIIKNNDVTNINEEKTYPKNRSLLTGIQSLIAEYDGEISTAEAVGVLEIVKNGLINGGDK